MCIRDRPSRLPFRKYKFHQRRRKTPRPRCPSSDRPACHAARGPLLRRRSRRLFRLRTLFLPAPSLVFALCSGGSAFLTRRSNRRSFSRRKLSRHSAACRKYATRRTPGPVSRGYLHAHRRCRSPHRSRPAGRPSRFRPDGVGYAARQNFMGTVQNRDFLPRLSPTLWVSGCHSVCIAPMPGLRLCIRGVLTPSGSCSSPAFCCLLERSSTLSLIHI